MKDPAAKLMRGLTEALVLASLRQEPKHGYALLKELEEVFGEAPNRNRIYPLLSRLEDEGYVEGRTDPDSSRGKTTYELTDAGRDRLAEYESMPPSFREALGRFWGAAEAAGTAGGEAGPREDEPDEAEGDGAPEEAGEGAPEGETREETAREAGGGEPDGEGAPGGGRGGGGGRGSGPSGEGDGGGMDLRRNPETGEVEMVIRGTHWGEVRIELGDIRDDDD